MEERYKRGVIYTIRNRNDDTLIYVGSTINNLSKRFNTHKMDCKKKKSGSLYTHIENDDWTDWYIELYENCPCNNKKELERREGQVIREIGTINKNVAGRTDVEYYIEVDRERKIKYRSENIDKVKEEKRLFYERNIDKIKEKNKIWRENNTDKIKELSRDYYINNIDIIKEKSKEKVCCDICGSFIRKYDIQRHMRAKKCMKHLNHLNHN